MKIAIVYNRESRSVINFFGNPNQERIGLQTIERISDALKKGSHQVATFEGDKDLIRHLETRYTHVPSMIEMVGIPYVASGPLAHTLSGTFWSSGADGFDPSIFRSSDLSGIVCPVQERLPLAWPAV